MSSSSLSPPASLSSSPLSSPPPSPNVSNFISNPPLEEECFATTPERKYYKKDDWFAKRCLRPSEYWTGPHGLIVPRAGKERIKNEAASLQFILDETNIPVPKVYGAFELDGAFWLITEYIEGVDLALLPKEKQLPVLKELEGHLETLQSLKSNSVGGPTGIIVPPYRITHATKQDFWNLRPSPTKEYVFCHNDLSQHNVIVDPETLKIKAIIDWEYAGFYPGFFEGRFYTRPGPSDALEKYNEKSDTSKLLEFLESLHINS
jgi:serine/threonine protein kinase